MTDLSLVIVYDVSTDITLSLNDISSGIITTDYRSFMKGDVAVDTLSLLLTSNIELNLNTLQGIVEACREGQKVTALPKVWLTRTINDVTSRSEVLDLVLVPGSDYYDRYFRSTALPVSLQITRYPFFYSSAVALPIYKDNDPATEDWITVNNGSDLLIDTTALPLTPCPLQVLLKNSGSSQITGVLVSVGEIAGAWPRLEGEDATGGTQKPSSPDSEYSEGYYSEISIDDTPQARLTWSNLFSIAGFAGFPVYFLLRLVTSLSGEVWGKVVLKPYQRSEVLAETVPVLMSETEEIYELGALQFPPIPKGLLSVDETTSLTGYDVELWLWGSSQTLGVDYLDAFVTERGVRKLEFTNSDYLAQNDILVVDEVERYYYITDQYSLTRKVYGTLYGNTLTIRKGISDPRLYLKCLGSGSHMQREVSIKLLYYPVSLL